MDETLGSSTANGTTVVQTVCGHPPLFPYRSHRLHIFLCVLTHYRFIIQYNTCSSVQSPPGYVCVFLLLLFVSLCCDVFVSTFYGEKTDRMSSWLSNMASLKAAC